MPEGSVEHGLITARAEGGHALIGGLTPASLTQVTMQLPSPACLTQVTMQLPSVYVIKVGLQFHLLVQGCPMSVLSGFTSALCKLQR